MARKEILLFRVVTTAFLLLYFKTSVGGGIMLVLLSKFLTLFLPMIASDTGIRLLKLSSKSSCSLDSGGFDSVLFFFLDFKVSLADFLFLDEDSEPAEDPSCLVGSSESEVEIL